MAPNRAALLASLDAFAYGQSDADASPQQLAGPTGSTSDSKKHSADLDLGNGSRKEGEDIAECKFGGMSEPAEHSDEHAAPDGRACDRQRLASDDVMLEALLTADDIEENRGCVGRECCTSTDNEAPPRWRKQLQLVVAAGCLGTVEHFHQYLVGLRKEADTRPESRFLVLLASIMSSQTRDEATLLAVERLCARFGHGDPPRPLPGSIAKAPLEVLEDCIRSVNYYKTKAKNLQEIARSLHDTCRDDGERFCVDPVPRDFHALVALPGVGPKVANLVRCVAFDDIEDCGMVVDTHVLRVSHRLGWTSPEEAVDAERTRRRLEKFIPGKFRELVTRRLIGFGQEVCLPRGPRCDMCALASLQLCPSAHKASGGVPTGRRNRKRPLQHADAENPVAGSAGMTIHCEASPTTSDPPAPNVASQFSFAAAEASPTPSETPTPSPSSQFCRALAGGTSNSIIELD